MSNLINKLLILTLLFASAMPVSASDLSGIEIMEEVYRRHKQYPYVYEQQSMVMRDRHGKRDTRKAHRYSRVEEDGTAKFMLIFDYPQEIEGVAVLAIRDPDGLMKKSVYLPAFAEKLIENSAENSFGNFLGTDFTVENIVGEVLSEYRYERRQDRNMNNTPYYVLVVFRRGAGTQESPLRRHFVRQDNFFIDQTEHFDNQGKLHKRQTYHDLKAVDGLMWRSGMILMEDVKEQHQSLLKVTRRWFSHDYVPAEMFTAEWLYENHPYVEPRPVEEELKLKKNLDPTSDSDEQISQLIGQRMEQP